MIGQSFGCELDCRIHRMSNLNISNGKAIEKKHYNLLAPGLSNKVSWVDSPGIILENFKPFYTLFVSPPKIQSYTMYRKVYIVYKEHNVLLILQVSLDLSYLPTQQFTCEPSYSNCIYFQRVHPFALLSISLQWCILANGDLHWDYLYTIQCLPGCYMNCSCLVGVLK